MAIAFHVTVNSLFALIISFNGEMMLEDDAENIANPFLVLNMVLHNMLLGYFIVLSLNSEYTHWISSLGDTRSFTPNRMELLFLFRRKAFVQCFCIGHWVVQWNTETSPKGFISHPHYFCFNKSFGNGAISWKYVNVATFTVLTM